MGCTALLFVTFLCILQCDLYQATNDNKPKTIVEIIIPPCSITNSRNQALNRDPSPCTPLLRNGCNKKKCNKSKQRNLKFHQHPFTFSIPWNGGKLNIITENIPSCRSNGKNEKPTVNNVENTDDVKVLSEGKVTNDGKPTVEVNSTVVADQNSGEILEETTANEKVGNTTVVVKTLMTYDDSGDTLRDTVQTNVTAENGQGLTSEDQIYDVVKDNATNSPKPSSEPKSPSAQNPGSSDNSPVKNTHKAKPSDSNAALDKYPNSQPPNTDTSPDKTPERPLTPKTVPPVPEETSPKKSDKPSDSNAAPDKYPNSQPPNTDTSPDKTPERPPTPKTVPPVPEETSPKKSDKPSDSNAAPDKYPKSQPPNTDTSPDKTPESPPTPETKPPVPEETSPKKSDKPSDSNAAPDKYPNSQPPNTNPSPDKTPERPPTPETEPPVPEETSPKKSDGETTSTSEEKKPAGGNNPPSPAESEETISSSTSSSASEASSSSGASSESAPEAAESGDAAAASAATGSTASIVSTPGAPTAISKGETSAVSGTIGNAATGTTGTTTTGTTGASLSYGGASSVLTISGSNANATTKINADATGLKPTGIAASKSADSTLTKILGNDGTVTYPIPNGPTPMSTVETPGANLINGVTETPTNPEALMNIVTTSTPIVIADSASTASAGVSNPTAINETNDAEEINIMPEVPLPSSEESPVDEPLSGMADSVKTTTATASADARNTPTYSPSTAPP